MRSIGCVVTAVSMLGGCGELSPEESAAVQAGGGSCPESVCMGNSPVIEYRGFHELHELGEANAEGLRLIGFRKAGILYDLDVAGGKLGSADGALSGAALVGAQLLLRDESDVDYILQVDEVGSVPYFADAGGAPVLETYLINWIAAKELTTGQWQNVCGDPPSYNVDTLGMEVTHVILFEGDRIDRHKRTVSPGDEAWFNLGCAGHAIAKLALTGHTEPARGDGFATTSGERQAMLKMLSADYCGDGTPYTIAGQPLQWKDHRGWMGYHGGVALEARWSSEGATCLNQPRIDAHPSDRSREVFGPDPIRNQILAACPLPACTGSALDLAGMHLASANPL